MPKIIATKQDWIVLGYQLFSDQGITGLIVEKMARKLKVNKSSFYWHFKTKKDFVNAIVGYWTETDTEQVIAFAENSSSPKEKWNNFLEIAFKKEPYLEFIFHLKKYANQHPDIFAIIEEIDQRRLAFTASLLEELGYDKSDAILKASIFYKYLIGYHEMIRHKPQESNYLKTVNQELSHFLSISI